MTSPFTHRRDRRRHEQEAAATVAGGGAGQGAYQQAGYSTKHYVDRHTRKGGIGVSADQVRMQDKALRANKKAYGMHLPNGSPGRNNVGYHRAYPKQLPHARTIRTLGHTHEGRLGMAAGAAATVAGAAAAGFGAHHLLNRKGSIVAKQSPFTVAIAKADRRFTGETADFTGHLPKHTPGIVAAQNAALKPKAPPLAAAVRNGLRATKLAKADTTSAVAKRSPFLAETVRKGIVGEAVDAGGTARKIGYTAGAATRKAGQAGAAALKPIGTAIKAKPLTSTAVAGAGGIGLGTALGRTGNNPYGGS